MADDELLVHDVAAVNAARVILNQNAIGEIALAVDDWAVGEIVQISVGPPIRKKNPVVQELNMKKCAAPVACFNDSHPNTLAQFSLRSNDWQPLALSHARSNANRLS